MHPLVPLLQVVEPADSLELREELKEELEAEDDALVDRSVVLVAADEVTVTVMVVADVLRAAVELAEELGTAEVDDSVTVDVAGVVDDDATEVVEEEAGGPGTSKVTPSPRNPASAIAAMTPTNVRLLNVMRSSRWFVLAFSPIFRTKEERGQTSELEFIGRSRRRTLLPKVVLSGGQAVLARFFSILVLNRSNSNDRTDGLSRMYNASSAPAVSGEDLNTKRKKRKFYAIMVIALGIVFGAAGALYFYQSTAIVSMNVLGNPHTSFVVVTGSETHTLSASENATFELPSHYSLTILASPSGPYSVSDWRIVGAADFSTSGGKASVTTGSGGSTIYVSVVLATNSSSVG